MSENIPDAPWSFVEDSLKTLLEATQPSSYVLYGGDIIEGQKVFVELLKFLPSLLQKKSFGDKFEEIFQVI